MKNDHMRILIFGGTTEAHRLSDKLCELSIPHTISVATEYGEQILTEDNKGGDSACRVILKGRMSADEIEKLIGSGGYELIIDATHPYATEVSGNILKAVGHLKSLQGADDKAGRVIKLFSIDRVSDTCEHTYEKMYIYDDNESAARSISESEGNILLTTGSKELKVYTEALGRTDADRLYVRVIPSKESIDLCEKAGIMASHIIAMQGPFDTELNMALIHSYDIKHLVTKESGSAGGYKGKYQAAVRCGIRLHVIGRPKEAYDTHDKYDIYGACENRDVKICGYDEMLGIIRSECGMTPIKRPDTDVSLIGMGMGSYDSLTEEAIEAMTGADVILGADRMIRQYRMIFGYAEAGIDESGRLPATGRDTGIISEGKLMEVMYKPSDITDYLESIVASSDMSKTFDKKRISVAVLFSGDSGFYSGCRGVYEALTDTGIYREGRLHIRIIPGISSVSYLASVTGRAYDTAYICSMHGKGRESIYRTASHVRIERDVYTLTSGYEDVLKLARILTDCGMGACRITVGFNLSLDDEKIISGTAEELYKESDSDSYVKKDIHTRNGDCSRSKCDIAGAGMSGYVSRKLCTCHIYNPAPCDKAVSAGLASKEFIRGSVPMTKEEVRTVTIDKLQLKPDSTVLDLGCGTGSVSVEIGRLIPDGMVYAIDRNQEAVDLTKKNVLKHRLPNVLVYKGEITDILDRICKGEDTKASGDGGLSTPAQITHAFIGGSGGRLSSILDMLKSMNPSMRIVVNAITERTKDTLKEWIEVNGISDVEVVRIQTDRGSAGALHEDMQAENGVYIYSFGTGTK